MGMTYQDRVYNLRVDNAKLVYMLKLKYLYEDNVIYDELEKSKNYTWENLVRFNRLLNDKIRMLQYEKEQQEKSMIFDERSLDEIINGYKTDAETIKPLGIKSTSGTIDNFTDMYKRYRKLREEKVEYKVETSSVIEQLKKLRRNA